MPYTGKISILVITAGVTLGALLGDAANPEPKQPPEQWWQAADSEAYNAPVEQTGWVDTSAGNVGFSDSYRPDFDYDTVVTSYWEPPKDWHWYGDDEYADSVPAETTAEEPAASSIAQDAADTAVEVADAAIAAQAAAPVEPAPEAPLTSEGLY